jgi:hypothetical protein
MKDPSPFRYFRFLGTYGDKEKSNTSHLARICIVIHFCWSKHFFNAEIARNFDYVSGKRVIDLRSIQNWTHRFADGHNSLENKFMNGWLMI